MTPPMTPTAKINQNQFFRSKIEVGPQAGPKWPKITKNGPPWGSPEGSVVQDNGQNQRGYCLGCLLAVFGPMWPRKGVRWVQNGFIWNAG